MQRLIQLGTCDLAIVVQIVARTEAAGPARTASAAAMILCRRRIAGVARPAQNRAGGLLVGALEAGADWAGELVEAKFSVAVPVGPAEALVGMLMKAACAVALELLLVHQLRPTGRLREALRHRFVELVARHLAIVVEVVFRQKPLPRAAVAAR